MSACPSRVGDPEDRGGVRGGARQGSTRSGGERDKLAADLKKKYAAGASIRELAESTGRSYGFVHRLLSESGVHAARTRRGHPRQGQRRARPDRRPGRSTDGARRRRRHGLVVCARTSRSSRSPSTAPTRATPRHPRPGARWPRSATHLPEATRVVVLRGAGPVFSAGIDLRTFTPEGVDGESILEHDRRRWTTTRPRTHRRLPARLHLVARPRRRHHGRRGAGGRGRRRVPARAGVRPARVRDGTPASPCARPRSASCPTSPAPTRSCAPSATRRALEICATGRWVGADEAARDRPGHRGGRAGRPRRDRRATSWRRCSPRPSRPCAPPRPSCARRSRQTRSRAARGRAARPRCRLLRGLLGQR